MGIIAKMTDAEAVVVAGFALVALFLVLTALCFMYYVNPGFLTLQGRQASDLAMLQTIAQARPEAITAEFVRSLGQREVVERERKRVDEEIPEEEEEDAQQIEEEMGKL